MHSSAFSALFHTPDLWQTLKEEKRDILLYGMGNGGDKILAVLADRGIPVAGVFASDGFLRGHSFHGMRVRSFAEVCAAYAPGACVILLAFGTARPDVIELIDRVAARYPLYVPDVPVCGTTLFDADFLILHRADLQAARALFYDELSGALFDNILAYKLTGRYDLLKAAVSDADRDLALLSPTGMSCMADLGAYNGDTAREMLGMAPLHTILAVEPDRRNFKKLSAWAESVTGCRIHCYPAAVGDKIGEAPFDASGNRNAGLCTGRTSPAVTVPTLTLDSIAAPFSPDYIKYDVEGNEAAALVGSAATIARCSPRLRVACYHRSEDLYALPLQLSALAPSHRLYLTRRLSLPGWDLDILAVPDR